MRVGKKKCIQLAKIKTKARLLSKLYIIFLKRESLIWYTKPQGPQLKIITTENSVIVIVFPDTLPTVSLENRTLLLKRNSSISYADQFS